MTRKLIPFNKIKKGDGVQLRVYDSRGRDVDMYWVGGTVTKVSTKGTYITVLVGEKKVRPVYVRFKSLYDMVPIGKKDSDLSAVLFAVITKEK